MFPARAGMSRTRATASASMFHVPRASGDEPHPGLSRLEAHLCSPRERG